MTFGVAVRVQRDVVRANTPTAEFFLRYAQYGCAAARDGAPRSVGGASGQDQHRARLAAVASHHVRKCTYFVRFFAAGDGTDTRADVKGGLWVNMEEVVLE